MKKDIISKTIIKTIIKDISKYILKRDIGEDFEFIDKEFERIESRRADVVLRVKNEYILHIELQSNYESKMRYRMLRYWLDIKEVYDLPIIQYLINLSSKTMKSKIEEFNYTFETINIKDLDCEYFLNIDSPEAVVMAILCDFKDKKPITVAQEIFLRLKQLIKDEKEFRKYVAMLEELSSLRELQNTIKEAEVRLSDLRNLTYQDLPSYQIGMEKGIEHGFEKGRGEGIIEAAAKVVKEFNLDINEVAKRFGLLPETIQKHIEQKSKFDF